MTAAATAPVSVDVTRVVDLAQQGYTTEEIAECLGHEPEDVDRALQDAVPGGAAGVRAALRTRLRAWHSGNLAETWQEAEAVFGIPHANITRLVRAPEADIGLGAAQREQDWGYLDAALAGIELDDERARTCVRSYAMGATLQELGDRFGVTRERIRQIVTKSTPWTTTEISRALRALRDARSREQKAAVQQWSRQHPGAEFAQAAPELGMTEEQVDALIGRRRRHHLAPAARTSSSSRRSDELILEDIRTYHRDTGKSTAAGFTDWAREHAVPGHQTASIRFGTWNEALRAAGIADVRGAPRSSFTDDDLWAAAIAAVGDPEGGTSNLAVDAWLQKHDGAPSLALIRQRLSYSWAEIATIALAALRGESTGGGEEMDEDWLRRVTRPRDWTVSTQDAREPVEFVREAMADLGVRLTSAAYATWAQEHGHPTAMTLQRRADCSWRELVLAAGGEPGRSKRRWTMQECLDAVAEFRAEHPAGTVDAYDQWRRDKVKPSTATVIKQVGSWRGAMRGCGVEA